MKRSRVRPSVCLSHHSTAAAAGSLLSAVRAGDIAINSGSRRAPQQHGAQQQMRAVSR